MGAKTGLYCVGNVNPGGKGMNGCVYDARGLAPAVTVNKGQGSKVFVDQTLNRPKVTEVARCLVAKYNGGLTNYGNSGVLETADGEAVSGDGGMAGARAVLTPDRVEKRQNGRRMKEAGEPMFTLTAQDQHGIYLPEEAGGSAKPEMVLPVRNATKQGYDMAYPGDRIVLSYPKSDSRLGRVGKGCSQTLDTRCMMGTVTRCGRIRRLTPRECFRLQGFPDGLYERAAAVNSETQLYKQAGSAVTATVAYAVAMALPESREFLEQMETVWEEFGDFVREAVRGDSDDSVPGTAWEDFGGFVPGTVCADFGGSVREIDGEGFIDCDREKSGGSVQETEEGFDDSVSGMALENFAGSVQEMGQEDFNGSVRGTAWEDFCDSVEEMESRNFNDYSVSGTARDDFGSIEKEEMAGEVLGDSGAEPDGDFDFLD